MTDEIMIEPSTRRQFLALIETGSLHDIQGLLDTHPTIVSVRNSSGKTPLMIAAYFGKQDICDALLNAGADLNDVDNNGRSAENYLENIGEVKNIEPIRMSLKEASIKVTLESERVKVASQNSSTPPLKRSNNDDIL